MPQETVVKSDVPLYLLPGMTPDDRIFDRLVPLLPNSSIVNWLEPFGGHLNESHGNLFFHNGPSSGSSAVVSAK